MQAARRIKARADCSEAIRGTGQSSAEYRAQPLRCRFPRAVFESLNHSYLVFNPGYRALTLLSLMQLSEKTEGAIRQTNVEQWHLQQICCLQEQPVYFVAFPLGGS